MAPTFPRRFRWLLAITLLPLLAGCSLAQFAYNRLDLLARWELSDYVDLDKSQRAVFDREFRRLWDWHRRNELPLYVTVLRMLAEGDSLADRAALETVSSLYRERGEAVMRNAAPIFCALGPMLSDRQVAELVETLEARTAEYASEYVEPPVERQRKDTERELRKQLDRWFGTLTAEQRQLIRTWVAERELSAEAWLAYRRNWNHAFAAVLEERQAPEYCERVTTLIVDGDTLRTPEQNEIFARNREQWLDLFERLGPTLTPAQRSHVRERMLALAEDFERLAAAAR